MLSLGEDWGYMIEIRNGGGLLFNLEFRGGKIWVVGEGVVCPVPCNLVF